jgi:hypothetical protein
MMGKIELPKNLDKMTRAAVAHYWETRLNQQEKQRKSGKLD